MKKCQQRLGNTRTEAHCWDKVRAIDNGRHVTAARLRELERHTGWACHCHASRIRKVWHFAQPAAQPIEASAVA